MNKFNSKFEAQVVHEETIATGLWYYQNEVACEATLVKQVWNYGSRDIPELDEILEIPYCDYINYNISDEGVVYFWKFSGPNTNSSSPSFATYFQARDHLDTYGTKHEIDW